MEYNIAPKVIAKDFVTMHVYKPLPDKHNNEDLEAIVRMLMRVKASNPVRRKLLKVSESASSYKLFEIRLQQSRKHDEIEVKLRKPRDESSGQAHTITCCSSLWRPALACAHA